MLFFGFSLSPPPLPPRSGAPATGQKEDKIRMLRQRLVDRDAHSKPGEANSGGTGTGTTGVNGNGASTVTTHQVHHAAGVTVGGQHHPGKDMSAMHQPHPHHHQHHIHHHQQQLPHQQQPATTHHTLPTDPVIMLDYDSALGPSSAARSSRASQSEVEYSESYL